MYVSLFFTLLLAHVLGDFYLQSEKICLSKRKSHLRSPWMYLHPMIVAGVSFLLVWDISFWPCALILLVSHFIFDLVKSYLKDTAVTFVLDQLLHVAVLVGISCLWKWTAPDSMYVEDAFIPEYLLSVLVLVKPANVLIKKILVAHQLPGDSSNKIGALIGSLERMMTFVFIIVGQFSAVGFLVTAKSVLRFKEAEKSEYVLAGTLLSFGIAILVGMAAYYGCFWWME